MNAAKQAEFLVLKITLTDSSNRVKGNPSRTISISAEESLFDLAYVITDIFNFDFEHAFGFYNNFNLWSKSSEGYELFADGVEGSKFPGVKGTILKNVFTERKKKMLFVFDYNEFWRFRVFFDGWMKLTGKCRPNEYLLMLEEGKAPSQY